MNDAQYEGLRRVNAAVASFGITMEEAAARLSEIPPPTPEEIALIEAAIYRRALDIPRPLRSAVKWWRRVSI